MNDDFVLQKEYDVHVYETDTDSKLNLTSLFNFFQDVASDHAEILGFGRNDLMKHNHFWVLSRMYAEISVWPVWGERIIVKTYPNGTDKLFALRNYEAFYPDGRPVASATSSWVILDLARKIQRPEAALSHFERYPERQNSLLRNATKLDFSGGELENSERFKVKISDLDINLHTNNVKYLQWLIDAYDLDFVKQHTLHSVEINYLAEAFINDDLMIQTYSDSYGFYNHSIIRSDGKELCRVQFRWLP